MKDIEGLIDRLLRAEYGARHEAADALRELTRASEISYTGAEVVAAIDRVMSECPDWDHPNDTNWLTRMVIDRLCSDRALNQEREKGVAEYHPPGGGFAGGGT